MKYNTNIVKGIIANALTSAATDHIVATTNDIYDEKLGQYQEDLNQEFKHAVEWSTKVWVEPIKDKPGHNVLCFKTNNSNE